MLLLNCGTSSSSHSDRALYSFLETNWFSQFWWDCSGRRRPTSKLLSRTAMILKCHRSVLERAYLIPFNRIWLDFLLYVVDMKIVPKCAGAFQIKSNGFWKPRLFKEFTSDWRTATVAALRRHYNADKVSFVCFCFVWQPSQYFLCKNIIENREPTLYEHLPYITDPIYTCRWRNKHEDCKNWRSVAHSARWRRPCICWIESESSITPSYIPSYTLNRSWSGKSLSGCVLVWRVPGPY